MKPLIIFEMANNHGGSLERGMSIIDAVHAATTGYDFDYAFKFQYRSQSYIHHRYRGKDDPPYVRRFESTRLDELSYTTMLERIRSYGWKTICTPFDEVSVRLIERQDYDTIKIASCSFTDWPLLECIAKANKSVIASTAGATIDDIDRVLQFFKHRNVPVSIMHCVGEYPTVPEHLELNQLDMFREQYPDIRFGLSSHEASGTCGSEVIAIAKGATILERHVDSDAESANAYSITPSTVSTWLRSIQSAIDMCGVSGKRHRSSEKEQADLRKFRRGVYAAQDIMPGDSLTPANIVCSYPNCDGQLVANDLSKYVTYTATSMIVSGSAIDVGGLDARDTRPLVEDAVRKTRELLRSFQVTVPEGSGFELSHHYGIECFNEHGAAIITVLNREYCKKLLVMLPGQKHPEHYHERKEESFCVLGGWMKLSLGIESYDMQRGDVKTVNRGVKHSFDSPEGIVFEEISTRQYPNDSVYTDDLINQNNDNRKTRLKFRAWG
jgi:N-acetylneuraminate synthase